MKTILAVLLIAVVFLGASALAATKTTLYLEWFPNQTHAPILAAQALGYYKAAGLDLSILPGSDDPTLGMKAITVGRAQFALVEVPTYIRTEIGNHLGLIAIGAYQQRLPYVWLAKPNSGIKNWADFRGKRVDRYGPYAPEAFLSRILEIYRIDPQKDIHWVAAGFGVAPLVSGQADITQGYINWEPIEAARLFSGVDVLKVGDIVHTYGIVIVTSSAWAKEHSDTVKAFLHATEEGFAYVKAHPGGAAKLVYEAAPSLNLSDIKHGIKESIQYTWNTEGLGVSSQLEMTKERWAETMKWTYFAGLVDSTVPVNALFTNQYLK